MRMAISSPLINIGNGKPVRANVPVQLNRQASRNGVRQSSVESYRDFTRIKLQRSSPTVDELSNRAGNLFRKVQSGQKVDLTI